MVGVSSILGTDLVTMGLYVIAAISGWVGPLAVFTAIGQANATLLVAIFPLIGLIAAIFILPEVYGFEHDAGPEPAPQPA